MFCSQAKRPTQKQNMEEILLIKHICFCLCSSSKKLFPGWVVNLVPWKCTFQKCFCFETAVFSWQSCHSSLPNVMQYKNKTSLMTSFDRLFVLKLYDEESFPWEWCTPDNRIYLPWAPLCENLKDCTVQTFHSEEESVLTALSMSWWNCAIIV